MCVRQKQKITVSNPLNKNIAYSITKLDQWVDKISKANKNAARKYK